MSDLTKSAFRTQYNKDQHYLGKYEKDQESDHGESVTVPGMALSVKEALDKYARGIDPMLTKNPQFSDPETFDDVNPMLRPDFDMADATEIMLRGQEAKEEIERIKTKKTKKEEPKNDPPADPPTE